MKNQENKPTKDFMNKSLTYIETFQNLHNLNISF